jgi:hypothetical protein
MVAGEFLCDRFQARAGAFQQQSRFQRTERLATLHHLSNRPLELD